MKGPWHRLLRVHRHILIFTSSALKTWVLHVNTFYSWILLYIHVSLVTAVNISILSVLYITHLLSFTKIRMFLYAQIYWLAEFGDISCLQFNYLRVGGFCQTILRVTLSSSPTKLCVQPESMIVDTRGGICMFCFYFCFFFKSVPISIYLNNDIVFGIN